MTNLAELDEYDVRRELTRKSLDVIDEIAQELATGTITAFEARTAVMALIHATRGLVPSNVSELMDRLYENASARPLFQETWLFKDAQFIYVAVDETTGDIRLREGEIVATKSINVDTPPAKRSEAIDTAGRLIEVAGRRGFVASEFFNQG